MALKNLFDMVKADKYTADGREEIIKAQEEETEDARRTYQIGEISEATGLQKTAQGWKPPKETKFGKVKQNKEGQWGVQTKQGKGSDFLKHKSEKEASRALANYTAGYNTTERSKQDPHSDQARQVKHWDKETEKIKKENRAEGRAAHAAQFQKPAAQEEIGKFYTKFKDAQSAYDAGRQTFPEGGYKIYNTPQGYKVVDDPKTQQRMEAAGYEVEVDVPEGTKPPKSPKDKPATGSKPDAADQRDQIGGEIKGNLEAAKYYFDKANSFSPTDPSYKTYMTKAKQYNDEAKAQADDNGFDFEEMHNSGITQAVNKYAEEQSKSAGQYSVENLPAVGSSVTFEGKINGNPIEGKGNVVGFITKNDKTYARVKTNEGSYDVNLSLLRGGRSGKDANKGKVITGNVEGKGGLWEPIYGEPQEDAAPRVLTGDTRIRVRKA